MAADINSVDICGRTPLMRALLSCQFKRAQFLVQHGADSQATDIYGMSPVDIMERCITSREIRDLHNGKTRKFFHTQESTSYIPPFIPLNFPLIFTPIETSVIDAIRSPSARKRYDQREHQTHRLLSHLIFGSIEDQHLVFKCLKTGANPNGAASFINGAVLQSAVDLVDEAFYREMEINESSITTSIPLTETNQPLISYPALLLSIIRGWEQTTQLLLQEISWNINQY
ncbi:MAG: hypothetical protein EZS28_001864 [Streblomastix strix]|uniref:Uncharacterized protein n=1 Tax=Streblomastix strix TaxID=222440 RepID=A0A5J4X5V8_9EUKA|nr:MAG: hypothetical protein EZS28_001864 [Streblomastix strix]